MADSYHVDDPSKIQGRDDIIPGTRNLGEIRLERALDALGDIGGRLLLLGAGAGRYARAIANARPDLDVFASKQSQTVRDTAEKAANKWLSTAVARRP